MSRLYLGKLNNVSHHELSRIVTQYGPIVDFLMKEKYAFVVFYPIFFLKNSETLTFFLCFQQYCNEQDARLALSELDGKISKSF